MGRRAPGHHPGWRALNGPHLASRPRLLAAGVLLLPFLIASRATAYDHTVRSGCHVEDLGSTLAPSALLACSTALPRVQEQLDVPLDVLVVVPRDDAQAAALVPQAGDLAGVAAVATEDRVVLVPTGFAGLSATGRTIVLAHEITHLATRGMTTGRTPLWLVEGFAEQVALTAFPLPDAQAASELAQDVRRGLLPAHLPAAASFGGSGAAQAYQQAWLVVDLLTRRYGGPALREAYRRAGAGGTAAALSSLGTTEQTLVAEWRRELTRRLR